METIRLPEPHTKIRFTLDVSNAAIEGDHTVKPFFTVAETVQLMKAYADACVGKKAY